MIDGNTFSDVYEYCAAFSDVEDPILNDLYRETHLKTLQPRMASGPLQGMFLTLICKMANVKNALEIGTFTGYATICMAKGMQQDGILNTIEINPELSHISNKYFNKSGFSDIIRPHLGDAIDIIPRIEEKLDLVFMDARKRDYQMYFDLVLPKMKKGGLILADNVLWDGKVMTEAKDKNTAALKSFNQSIKKDERVEVMILPLRDGVSMIRVR